MAGAFGAREIVMRSYMQTPKPSVDAAFTQRNDIQARSDV
jgi:hypothetical protein